jgi:hypothetical protein
VDRSHHQYISVRRIYRRGKRFPTLIGHCHTRRHSGVAKMHRVLAISAAIGVFLIAICAVAVATPLLFKLFYSCAPHDGSCGDTAGWGMVIMSPILVPTTVLLAGVCSVVTYLRVMAIGSPGTDSQARPDGGSE